MNSKALIAACLASVILVGGIAFLAYRQISAERDLSRADGDRTDGRSVSDDPDSRGPRTPGSAIGSPLQARLRGQDGNDGPGPASGRGGASDPSSRGGRGSYRTGRQTDSADGESSGDPRAQGGLGSGSGSLVDPRLTSALLAIVEDGNHEAVEDVTVQLRGGRSFTAITDAAGVAAFENAAPGTYQVYLSRAESPRLNSSQPVVLVSGQRAEARFIWVPFDETVSGRVLDDTGLPLEGVPISIRPLSSEEGDNPLRRADAAASVTTDAEGRFSFDGLAAAEHLLMTAPMEGFPSVRRSISASAEGLEIVLHEEVDVLVYGQVTDTAGIPLEGVSIRSTSGGLQARSTASGSFEMTIQWRDAPTSRTVITARADAYVPVDRTLFPNQIEGPDAEGLRSVEFQFEMEPIEDLATIVGELVDIDGAAVGGERVYLHSRSVGARYHGASNGEGRFEIRNVRASEDYRLWVYPRTGYKDKTIERVDVQPGENAIRVVLEPVDRGVLEGVVLDARRRPVARLTLHIRSMQSLANSITTTTDQRGYFRVEDAPAGDILMETRALPKVSVRGIHLEAGTTRTVEVIVGIGNQDVVGTVEDANGNAVPGARIIATWDATQGRIRSSLYNETVTDTQGRFEIHGFGPGQCTVAASLAGHRPARQEFRVTAAGAERIVLRLESTGK